jgi:hypothetical protein
MRNFLLGLSLTALLSLAFAAGTTRHGQASGQYEIRQLQFGEFVPDEYVTDGPSYLKLLEDHKTHSQSTWNQISSLGVQGWEPVSMTTTVAQYQSGKGYTTVVLLKHKLN